MSNTSCVYCFLLSHFCDRLYVRKDEKEIVMFVSPLTRTVETAREVLKGLGSASKTDKKKAAKGAQHNLVGGIKFYVRLEPGFAEDARAMRRWMLGHHKKMNNTTEKCISQSQFILFWAETRIDECCKMTRIKRKALTTAK